MKPDIKIEYGGKVAFKVLVEEYKDLAIVYIDFDQRYKYYASNYGVCHYSEDDLTLGIFPDGYDDLSAEKQRAWDETMPVVRVRFYRKYMGWVFNANDKETNAFLVVTPGVILSEPLCSASIRF